MPDIARAMQLSRRRGIKEILVGSLLSRDIASVQGQVSDAKNTFSTWDGCMAKAYCKWPFIIGIVVGSLILLSIITCIVRCACCGYSCCCACFRCPKCCDCCGDCCEGKRNKPHKHLEKYDPGQGYTIPMPMMTPPVGGAPPQYAQFEVGKNGLAVDKPVNGDALPPMPSWDAASKKHVLTEEEKNNVELGQLDPVSRQKIPLMTGGNASPVPPSPTASSPYGPRPGQGLNGGYMSVPQNQNNTGYRGTPGPGGPGLSPMGPPRSFGTPPPQAMGIPSRNNSPQPPGPDGYMGAAGGGRSPYSNGPNQRFPPQPQRQYSGGSSRPPNSVRQYSDNSGYFQQAPPGGPIRSPGPIHMPSPGNGGGFDFGLPQHHAPRPSPNPQYGRNSPSNSYMGNTAPPTYATNTPPPREPQTQAYPGYRPYQPQNSGTNGTPRSHHPGGSGPEPESWDPVRT